MRQVYNNLLAELKHDISASKHVLITQNNSRSRLFSIYSIAEPRCPQNIYNRRFQYSCSLQLQNKGEGVYYRIFVYEIRN